MKKLKSLFSLILALLFLTMIVSCKNEDSSSPTSSANILSNSTNTPSNTLSLDSSSHKLVTMYLVGEEQYVSINPLVRYLESQNYEIKIETVESWETVNAEMIAGGGPDIFIFDQRNGINMMPGWRGYLESGAFADINELIEKDQSDTKINLSDFKQPVVEAGKYKGKQLLFPLAYSPCYLYTTEEKCMEYSIELPKEGIRLDEITTVFQNYIERAGGKALFYEYPLQWMGFVSGTLIDYENGTTRFSDPQFLNYLNAAKHIQLPSSGIVDYTNAYDLLNNEVPCKWNGDAGANADLLLEYNNALKELGQTPVLCGIRDEQTEGYLSIPTFCFAINQNSNQKEQAYEILKKLLSEETQSNQSFRGVFDVPVLNKATDALMEFLQNPPGGMLPLADEFIASYRNILDEITACDTLDLSWTEEVLSGPFTDYQNWKMTEEQLIQALENKTNLYLKE